MSAEELEKLLAQLGNLSDAEFGELLEMLAQAQSMGALMAAIRSAKDGLGDKASGMSDAELARMLARLESLMSQGQGGMGPQAGEGRGGQAPRGEDDGRGEEPEKVAGRLDPNGDLGPRVPFHGIPRRKEAEREFDLAVENARSAAEESLGRDLLPPDARPIVRRYFDSLEKDGRKK